MNEMPILGDTSPAIKLVKLMKLSIDGLDLSLFPHDFWLLDPCIYHDKPLSTINRWISPFNCLLLMVMISHY